LLLPNSITAAPSTLPLQLPVVPDQPQTLTVTLKVFNPKANPNPNPNSNCNPTCPTNPTLQHDCSVCSHLMLLVGSNYLQCCTKLLNCFSPNKQTETDKQD